MSRLIAIGGIGLLVFIGLGAFSINSLAKKLHDSAYQDGMKTILLARSESENIGLRADLEVILEEARQGQIMMQELAGYDDKTTTGPTAGAFADIVRNEPPILPRKRKNP